MKHLTTTPGLCYNGRGSGIRVIDEEKFKWMT